MSLTTFIRHWIFFDDGPPSLIDSKIIYQSDERQFYVLAMSFKWVVLYSVLYTCLYTCFEIEQSSMITSECYNDTIKRTCNGSSISSSSIKKWDQTDHFREYHGSSGIAQEYQTIPWYSFKWSVWSQNKLLIWFYSSHIVLVIAWGDVIQPWYSMPAAYTLFLPHIHIFCYRYIW